MQENIGPVKPEPTESGKPVANLKKAAALEALREIQRAFAESGIREEELQEEGKRIRREIAVQKYWTAKN